MDVVRFRLRVFCVVILAIMVLGIFGFMVIEDLSFADAFYFTIVTIATVGYGDIHPSTQAGKIVAVLLIITGVGAFLGVVANATEMVLNRRERQARQQKLNMVIGLFFSEVGTKLLTYFARFDPEVENIRGQLTVSGAWSEQQFNEVKKRITGHKYEVEIEKVPQGEITGFFDEKSDLILRLLENPSLLEHESFADLLRAIFHLRDELLHRPDITQLPEADKAHLMGDVKRVYRLLALHWLDHMQYLKANYPYLFSLALRTNPFDMEASVIIR